MRTYRPQLLEGHRLQPALIGILFVCPALLVASCGSLGPSPDADQTTNAGSSAQTVASDTPEVALIDLDDANEVAGWTTVNDPVMGGMSTSRVAFDDGGLVFSGTISLDNNGGFASARSPQDPEIGRRATDAQSLNVRARGDGKTYLLKVGVDRQSWSYIQRFPTEAGVQRTYELPVKDFRPVGMRLDPAPDAPQTLDPSRIDQVAIYILDKQQGPFEITVYGIGATD